MRAFQVASLLAFLGMIVFVNLVDSEGIDTCMHHHSLDVCVYSIER